ncbi:hypothetical protein EJB05_45792 [Eragrostis curvula]|uniref:Uncharacterized protein n=1 Tax=Eragrostis curvula TaxID=38414 RepID=A0A5J9TLH7_9POAL|nr:hypothetical protein EJB05_45792 [Eragrostis curvula]
MESTVIAAHRHSILFKVTVPFEDPDTWHYACCFPLDYFVYSASTSPPSLTRLPPCFEGGAVNPQVDEMFMPYRNQRQRTMMDQDMGILSHDDDDDGGEYFTVADLGTVTGRLHQSAGGDTGSHGVKSAPDLPSPTSRTSVLANSLLTRNFSQFWTPEFLNCLGAAYALQVLKLTHLKLPPVHIAMLGHTIGYINPEN